MANKHMKRCSVSAAIGEMQIRTTRRCSLVHMFRTAKIKKKKTDNTKCWQGLGESRPLTHCWWDGKMVVTLVITLAVSKKNEYITYHMTQQ